MVDLRMRIPRSVPVPGPLADAFAINNAGQMVVMYQSAQGTGTYRLTPVIDSGAPTASADASPSSLWPPNLRMIPVSVNVTAADEFDPAPACAITSVRSSEAPAHGTDLDVRITGPFSVSLRAWAWNLLRGRTYTIKVGCTDFSGNTTVTETAVVVRLGHHGG